MQVIKLNATDSTNLYLKELIRNNTIENYTVVVAKRQNKGRGQMGTVWTSEEDKNLIMSILIRDFLTSHSSVFVLNSLISVAINKALETLKLPELSIKWPNDIMSGNKKIGGVLIENIFQSNGKIESVVGIGLNVNQTHFPDLPSASSLQLIMNQEFDIDSILGLILNQIKQQIAHFDLSLLTANYENNLFHKEKLTMFEDINGNQFMGIIQGVNSLGELQVLHQENNSLECYNLKQIKMIY